MMQDKIFTLMNPYKELIDSARTLWNENYAPTEPFDFLALKPEHVKTETENCVSYDLLEAMNRQRY